MTTLCSAVFLASCLVGLTSGQGSVFGSLSPEELNRLLSDGRYVQQQIGCVLGRANCDTTGSQLKLAIPEVLLRNCRSCNPQQAQNARLVIDFIRNNYPQEWSQILNRYTPLSQKKGK